MEAKVKFGEIDIADIYFKWNGDTHGNSRYTSSKQDMRRCNSIIQKDGKPTAASSIYGTVITF